MIKMLISMYQKRESKGGYNMKKKFLSFLVAGCLVGTTAMPGAVMAETEDLSGTKITFLNTKTEIQDYLEDMGKAFEDETGIEIEFYTNT